MSKLVLTPDRTHWIHDFDGVQYDTRIFDDLYGDIYQFYGQAKLTTARRLMPNLDWSDEEIIRRGKESYLVHKDGLKVYIDFAVASRMTGDADAFHRQFHREYHKAAFANAMQTHAAVIRPDPEILRAMEALDPFVRHGMVTMSCLQTWAVPFSQRIDILRFFEPDALVGAEETDFLNKKDSTRPLQIGMEKLGACAEQTIFIEDTVENLERAKDLDRRILTVLITEGNYSGPVPSCVDICAPTQKVFLQKAKEVFAPLRMGAQASPALVAV